MKVTKIRFDGDMSLLEAKVKASVDRLQKEFLRLKSMNSNGNFSGFDNSVKASGGGLVNIEEIKKQYSEINNLSKKHQRLVYDQVRSEIKQQQDASRQKTAIVTAEARKFAEAEKSKARIAEITARRHAQESIQAARAAENAKKREYQEFVRLEREKARATRSNFLPSTNSKIERGSIASFTGNLAADAVAQTISLAKEGAAAWLDYSSKLQQTKIGFTTLLGNGEKANKLLQEIQQFSKSTPFEFGGLTQLSQRLLGANVEAEKIIPLMRDIGNIVAATGETSQERLEGVTVAITQMISKQKVSAEEMEQLAERGINGFQLLSEATGKPQAELRKLAEQGKISSSVMVQALQQISQQKFGDAMEKQSRTLSGAMSNIKDTLLITANTAFQPLFDKISSVAVRFADEIQSKGGDFEAIGSLIAQYIGEGLAKTVPTIAELTGKGFASIFAKTVKGEWSGVGFLGIDFLRGQFDAITGGKVFSGIPDLVKSGMVDLAKKFNAELDKTAQKTKDLKAIDDQLKIDKAVAKMKALNEQWKFASDLTKNLSLQVRFFGNETEEAAVKQQLLGRGITDFSQGWAKFAVEAAKSLDVLKANKQAQDDFNKRFESFADEVRQVREDAEFKLQFANPSELDEFNRKVNQSGLEFKGLAFEINQTREALRLLALSREYDKAGASTKQFVDSLKSSRQSIEELSQVDVSPFQDKIRELLKGIELFTVAGEKLDNNGIANQIEKKILTFQRDLANINDWASAAIGDPEQISEQLKIKTQKIIDDWHANFVEYMRTIRQKVQSNGEVSFTSFFEGEGGNQETANELIYLFNAVSKAANSENLSTYKNVVDDLDSEIQKLNVELGYSAEISRADALAKMLQTDAYKNLTPEMKKVLEAKAEEVDRLKAAKDAQEEYRKAFDETFGLVRDSLDILTEQGKSLSERFGGFFKNIAQRWRDMLLDMAAQWLTSKIFNIFGGGILSGNPIGGIFGSIFGGGSFGTPSFNPNSAQTGIPFAMNFGSSTTSGIHDVVSNGGIQNTLITPNGKTFSTGGKLTLGGGLMLGGMAASLIGSAIGGRAGSFLSNIGSGVSMGASIGSIIPGLGTVAGAVIGGAVGLLGSILGGDPKRKADKKQLPQLQKGFDDALAQLRQLVQDTKSLRIDPESALAKAQEIRNEIANSFGLNWQSKKYQKVSAQQIQGKLSEADSIIAQLRDAADVARAANDRNRRILPEFSTGGFLGGTFDRKDDIIARLSRGEMVLNPSQMSRVKAMAGFDVFAHAGIPNYPKKEAVPRFADGGVVSGFTQTNFAPNINLNLNLYEREDGGFDAYLDSDAGQRKVAVTVNKLKKNKEIS